MKITTCVFGAAVVAAAGAASATTFDITWSGAPYGDAATATGYITVDSTLPIVGFSPTPLPLPLPGLTALSITITGASSGDGTFGIGDFGALLFWTPTALDLTQELIGQPVSGGTDFYGDTNGLGGDFNLFGDVAGAPYGTSNFELGADDGTGDQLQVTSIIAEAAPTPEPAAWTMMLVGFGLAGAALRRRTAATIKA